MAIINEAEFRKQIKTPKPGGYLFFGEEDYLKAHALRLAREAVCPDPGLAVFNDIRLDALDFSAGALLSALAPPPMMSDLKIVTVEGLDFGEIRGTRLSELTEALAELSSSRDNLLILSAPNTLFDPGYLPKRPSSLLKTLEKYLTPVQFDAVSPTRLAAWAARHFEHHALRAPAEICSYLVEFCQKDMFSLSAEIEKVSAYVRYHGREEVTREDIDRVAVRDLSIGGDNFAMADAMLSGDYDRALTILDYYRARRVEPVLVLSEITAIYSDLMAIKLLAASCSPAEIAAKLGMHAYKVGLYARRAAEIPRERLSHILGLLAEADALLKQQYASGYLPIERLICAL